VMDEERDFMSHRFKNVSTRKMKKLLFSH
jgi:hypothetical protein